MRGNKRFLEVICLLIIFGSNLIGQGASYPYTIKIRKDGITYAFINAKIFIDYRMILDSAVLIVKNGEIVDVGKNISIPKSSIVFDLKGKNIMPAFIDLYSDYGVERVKLTYDTVLRERPIYGNPRKGPFYWNMAIHPEVNPLNYFRHNEERADKLRKMGIGGVLSHIPDGIIRGNGIFILLDTREDFDQAKCIESGLFLSLNKGSSPQEYPSSAMGAIALIRQHFYDALWYGKQDTEYKNYSLITSYKYLQEKRSFFCFTSSWKEALSFLDIKNEFAIKHMVIVGSWEEYRAPWHFKGIDVVLPLTIPELPPLKTIKEVEAFPIMTLKHWELAPITPLILSKNNSNVSFSAYEVKDFEKFNNAIQKVRRYGFPDSMVLKALTYNPARILQLEKKLAQIKKGNPAFFIITEGFPGDSLFFVYEVWIGKNRYINRNVLLTDLRGRWVVPFPYEKPSILDVSGRVEKPTIKLILPDSTQHNVQIADLSYSVKSIVIDLKGYKDTTIAGKWEGIFWFTSDTFLFIEYLKKDNILRERLLVRRQEHYKVPQMAPQVYKEKDIGDIWYPFSPYGFSTPLDLQNEKKRYLLKGGTVYLFDPDTIISPLDILIENGKIKKIGRNILSDGAIVIDCKGKHITPGIIDEHSHIAIWGGVNEYGDAISSEVRIADVINPEDVDIYRALSGGVCIAHLLHGSANPIGGQTAIIKLRWGASKNELIYEKAPPFIKFALGENVKQSNWGDNYNKRYPQTRMGVREIIKDAFINAKNYLESQKSGNYRRDLRLEALGEILQNRRFITCHSYVQSEILMMMELGDELGFKVNTFTHVLEGYKIARELASKQINASTFSDWWAYKFEVYEATPYGPYIMKKNGVNVCINSDSPEMGRRLNQEAAKSIKYGGLSPIEALKMVTLNAAKALRIDKYTGSISENKDADIVIWSHYPFSQYAIVEKNFVDGMLLFDREKLIQVYERNRREKERLVRLFMERK